MLSKSCPTAKPPPGGELPTTSNRIVPIHDDYGRNSHDEIFLDRSDQLQGVRPCTMKFTPPHSMVYSNRANDLEEIYGNPTSAHGDGLQTPKWMPCMSARGWPKMQGSIDAPQYSPTLADVQLGRDVFEKRGGSNQLCLASGGHVRELLLLVKRIPQPVTETLPIPNSGKTGHCHNPRYLPAGTVEKEQWQGTGPKWPKPPRQSTTYRTPPRPAVSPAALMENILNFDERGHPAMLYDAHPG